MEGSEEVWTIMRCYRTCSRIPTGLATAARKILAVIARLATMRSNATRILANSV
jgi:hypothetical protein